MNTKPRINQHESWRLSRNRLMFIGFLAIAGFFLFTEHRAHAIGFLPLLLLLALCPLMHLFGHGHGGHSGKEDQRDNHSESGP